MMGMPSNKKQKTLIKIHTWMISGGLEEFRVVTLKSQALRGQNFLQ